jgi:hypothetical protein
VFSRYSNVNVSSRNAFPSPPPAVVSLETAAGVKVWPRLTYVPGTSAPRNVVNRVSAAASVGALIFPSSVRYRMPSARASRVATL